MTSRASTLFGLALLVLTATACKKEDPVAELEKSAAAMDKAPAAPAEAGAEANPGPAPAEQVKKAIADFKAGKMEDAVTRLQLLRAQPAMTPEQRMALQDSIASVMQEVYAQAQNGDARAKAAVAQYERLQTAR
ncbi:MAG: hypothetical protein RLZZ356_2120 [Verrucomicrobiota bacterium]|jgi:hypothetical protein